MSRICCARSALVYPLHHHRTRTANHQALPYSDAGPIGIKLEIVYFKLSRLARPFFERDQSELVDRRQGRRHCHSQAPMFDKLQCACPAVMYACTVVGLE